MFINHIYLIYMYKEDLALNNLQWLISHKTKPNQILCIQCICIKGILHINNLQLVIYYKIKPN